MKRIKLVLISSFFAFFTFSSCEDAYNIVQDGELTESEIKTVTALQDYFNGFYANVSISDQIGFTGIFTDETSVGRGNGGGNKSLHRFFLTIGDDFVSRIWYDNYETINRVNRLIRMAENQVPVPTDPAQLAQYNGILAQARALRAFSYFQLLTYFSTDMRDDSALGVMLFTNVPSVEDDLPRVANGLVFAQIEDDLSFAFANVSPSATYKYVSKNMINAMRARMYLYRGNYPLAKQYAQDVISNSGLVLTPAVPIPSPIPANPYSNLVSTGGATTAWNNNFYSNSTVNPPIVSQVPYRRMWQDLIQGEVIWALDRPATGAAGTWENVAGNFTTNNSTISGSPLWEVSRALFNKYASTMGDVRRYANVDPTSLLNPNYATVPNYISSDVIVIDKYPGKPGFATRNDIKVFRLSEMYLILAECLANEGNINGPSNSVASVIKQIRDARNFLGPQPLPVYADATAALSSILAERRLELSFEGHRYIDIKRLGPLTNETLDRDNTDDDISGQPLSIPNNDYRFTLPIPLDELNGNVVIRAQQNPGYL